MPDLNGLATYEQLKPIDPQIRGVLSSGYRYEDVDQEMLDRGATDFIQKPFHLTLLYKDGQTEDIPTLFSPVMPTPHGTALHNEKNPHVGGSIIRRSHM